MTQINYVLCDVPLLCCLGTSLKVLGPILMICTPAGSYWVSLSKTHTSHVDTAFSLYYHHVHVCTSCCIILTSPNLRYSNVISLIVEPHILFYRIANEQCEIWTNSSHSFTKKGLLQLPVSRIGVATVTTSKGMSAGRQTPQSSNANGRFQQILSLQEIQLHK